MKERDIRTDDDLEYRWSLYRQDQQRLLARSALFVEVNCPACENPGRIPHYQRDGFNFVRCDQCGSVYVSPRPTKTQLLEHYKQSLAEKYWIESIYPKTESGRQKHLFAPRIARILDLCRRQGYTPRSMVDVGGGNGAFAAEALHSGAFETVAVIEPDPSPAGIARSRGLSVYENFIENLFLDEQFDIATSIESIEHVFDPGAFVSGIARILKPGGLLVITTPNVKGFDLLVLKDKSDNTTAPDHLNYFHPDSLSHLLKRCGFTTIDVSTPGKLDVELVRKKALAGAISLEGQPFLQRIVVDEYERYGASFQTWLAENGLSSHLWIVARKD